MSVSILVVYTGEETIRNWLQTKVKERQLYIRNDPGELEAGMKTVDIGRKNFDLISTSGSGTHDVIDISFVQGWFRSRVLGEDLFLDMPHAILAPTPILHLRSTRLGDASPSLLSTPVSAGTWYTLSNVVPATRFTSERQEDA